MAAEHENPENVPDKRILSKCITAFEIAIEEIKKIENGVPLECKKINPNGFMNCPGATDEALAEACQRCSKYVDFKEPTKLREKALTSLKAELLAYGKRAYTQGYLNGSKNLGRFEDDVECELQAALFETIEKWRLSQNIIIS